MSERPPEPRLSRGEIPDLPSVTVLMPAYNAGKFVAEAIRSILRQTLQSFELLIVDDCSTDDSVRTIESFHDPRIRLLRNKQNEGITASLNRGIAEAEHELIARVDADDVCHPQRLEKQAAYMREHPHCAMVSSWVRLVDEEGRYIRTEGTRNKYLYYNLFFECCIYHPTVMLRKGPLEEAGNYRWRYAEDFELFRRLSRQFEIGGIDEPLLDYRMHSANTNTARYRKEYDDFSLELLRTNMRDCLGESAEVPLAYLECYRYRYDPLLEQPGLNEVHRCLDLLDQISTAISTIPNPNRHPEDIEYMRRVKKNFIVRGLSRRLPLRERAALFWKYQRRHLVYLGWNRLRKKTAPMAISISTGSSR